MLLLAIFAGGALGAVARWGLSGWVYGRLGSAFPWGTLSVNVTGSLALGLLVPVVDLNVPPGTLQGFLTIGGIGAFTTFSTFAYETVMLLREGQVPRAGAYVGASLLLGLASLAVGLALGSLLF